MDINKKRSESGPGGRMPAMQVVGFHVEGSSSPGIASVLGGNVPVGAGSPTPVIIPPSFQSVAAQPVSHPVSGPVNQPTTTAGPVAGIAPTVPASCPQTQGLVGHTTSAPPSSVPTPIPTPQTLSEGGAPPTLSAAPQPQRIAPLSCSMPKPIAQAEKAMEAHRGLQHTDRQDSIASSLSSMAETAHTANTAAPSAATSKPAKEPRGPPPEKKEKPQLTRAQRREIQDSQRAAKAAAKAGGAPPGKGSGTAAGSDAASVSQGGAPPKSVASSVAATAATSERKSSRGGDATPAASGAKPDGTPRSVVAAGDESSKHPPSKAKGQGGKVVSLNSTELFAHLQQYRPVTVSSLLSVGARDPTAIHPAVVQLGLRYADGSVKGANARCMAMLHALAQVVRDYSTPEGKSLSRDLTQHLNGIINFLVDCRPLSVSMGNAIKFLKLRVSKIDPSTPEEEAKEELLREIQEYVNVRIVGADKLLVASAVTKVDHGDVVMVYAYSHVVHSVLVEAAARGIRFRVVVVDSRPELEGRVMLQKLLQAGITCTYTSINGLSYIIHEVSKVFLGAAAVLSNGTVMGRAGSALVAMMAHADGKPVMICCESYKFHERVQLDSITHNELGDPEALVAVPGRSSFHPLSHWKENPRLGLLNLKYDAMPSEYVTMIVTEFGMIPPTSVPVILREYRQET